MMFRRLIVFLSLTTNSVVFAGDDSIHPSTEPEVISTSTNGVVAVKDMAGAKALPVDISGANGKLGAGAGAVGAAINFGLAGASASHLTSISKDGGASAATLGYHVSESTTYTAEQLAKLQKSGNHTLQHVGHSAHSAAKYLSPTTAGISTVTYMYQFHQGTQELANSIYGNGGDKISGSLNATAGTLGVATGVISMAEGLAAFGLVAPSSIATLATSGTVAATAGTITAMTILAPASVAAAGGAAVYQTYKASDKFATEYQQLKSDTYRLEIDNKEREEYLKDVGVRKETQKKIRARAESEASNSVAQNCGSFFDKNLKFEVHEGTTSYAEYCKEYAFTAREFYVKGLQPLSLDHTPLVKEQVSEVYPRCFFGDLALKASANHTENASQQLGSTSAENKALDSSQSLKNTQQDLKNANTAFSGCNATAEKIKTTIYEILSQTKKRNANGSYESSYSPFKFATKSFKSLLMAIHEINQQQQERIAELKKDRERVFRQEINNTKAGFTDSAQKLTQERKKIEAQMAGLQSMIDQRNKDVLGLEEYLENGDESMAKKSPCGKYAAYTFKTSLGFVKAEQYCKNQMQGSQVIASNVSSAQNTVGSLLSAPSNPLSPQAQTNPILVNQIAIPPNQNDGTNRTPTSATLNFQPIQGQNISQEQAVKMLPK